MIRLAGALLAGRLLQLDALPVATIALVPGAGVASRLVAGMDGCVYRASGAATPACTGRRDGSATSLTPGSSDATPRLPGPRRAPTAGILALHGNAWTWKPITDLD